MWPFKNKKLEDLFFKKIKVHGVVFTIQKLDPLSFLDGSKTMLQTYDIYKINDKNPEKAQSFNKIKEHFKDVFMASIIEPKLKRKPEEGDGILVDYLFTEWDLANELYVKIIDFTYGKKKIKLSI